MPFSLWIALLLVPAGAEAQSGDAEMDAEPTIICTSHISQKLGNSLTCNLAADSRDDEDAEDAEGDDIESMTVCYYSMIDRANKCAEGPGNTITIPKNYPIIPVFEVAVQLKSGGEINTALELRKIVKPKSPQVWNATFYPQSNKAVIHIRSPYREDYLTAKNQLFQLYIWSEVHTLINNITESQCLTIEGEHLRKDTEYHVKVRAIPNSKFEGTWSEWSADLNFSTGVGEGKTFVRVQLCFVGDVQGHRAHFPSFFLFFKEKAERTPRTEETQALVYNLTGSVVILLLVTWSVVFFCRKKIHTYIWPSIPHPKHALVQIYKPIKGLPVSFNPELFNDLDIYPVEKIEYQRCGERTPVQLNEPLGETSDSSRSNSSINTEESDLSALLSGSASGGGEEEEELEELEEEEEEEDHDPRRERPPAADVLQVPVGAGEDAPRPERDTGKNHPEMYGITQQGKDEAYVTMSSFYQIK